MRGLRPWAPLLALLLGGAAPALAQQRPRQPAAAQPAPAPEPELRFEREYFVYPTRTGRDPFTSLAAQSGMGPRFEDLELLGVIHSPDGQSVVLLGEEGGRIHRARRGQVVGNARVITIAPMRVVFAVENFGVVRQEILELKRKDNEGGQP
jgi:hypothetical protein